MGEIGREDLYLRSIALDPAVRQEADYYAQLPTVQNLAAMDRLTFRKPVTFFVGRTARANPP